LEDNIMLLIIGIICIIALIAIYKIYELDMPPVWMTTWAVLFVMLLLIGSFYIAVVVTNGIVISEVKNYHSIEDSNTDLATLKAMDKAERTDINMRLKSAKDLYHSGWAAPLFYPELDTLKYLSISDE
jgi:hypothetical protein